MAGGQSFSASAGSVARAVTVALLGASLSLGQGSVTPNSDGTVPLTGQSVTTAPTAPSPGWSQALSGAATTLAIQSVSISLRPTDVVGQAVSASAGTATAQGDGATAHLSGQEAVSGQGAVTSGTQLLNGGSISIGQGSVPPGASQALSGQASACSAGFVAPEQDAVDSRIDSSSGVVVGASAVALSGASSALSQGAVTVSGDASIALSGQASSSEAGAVVHEESYALSGASATLAQFFVGAPGGASLVGASLSVVAGDVFTTNDRTFALSGAESATAPGSCFASPLAFVAGQSIQIDAQSIGPRTSALSGLSVACAAGLLSAPSEESRHAGHKKRHRERYIARYKGQDHEFATAEDLEQFVEQAREAEKQKPKKYRKPIKIRVEEAKQDEDSEFVEKVLEFAKLQPEQPKFVNQPEEMAEEDDEDEVLLWLM